MKLKKRYSFLFFFSSMLFAMCTSMDRKDKNVKITLEIDSVFCTEDQWLYMFYPRENQISFEDSVKIGRSKKRVTLYGFIEEQGEFEFFFEKHGPNQLLVIVSPGDDIFIKVKEEDGIGMVWPSEVKGSPATVEQSNHNKNFRKATLTLYNLEGNLYAYQDKDSSFLQMISDSINLLNQEIAEKELAMIKTSPNPHNVHISLLSSRLKTYIGMDSFNILLEEARERFPNHDGVKYIYKGSLKAKSSEESKINFKRIHQMVSDKRSKIKKREQETQLKNAHTSDLTGISNNLPELRGRNALLDFSLESNDSSRVLLSQFKGKFVLLDFWASWCIPCLEEMPIVKRAHVDYSDKLAVCLISIDVNHLYWRNAIKRYKLEHLTNLIATNKKGELDENIERLEIKTIPANYLLDDEGNIVAKDVRGHELLDLLKKHLGDKE